MGRGRGNGAFYPNQWGESPWEGQPYWPPMFPNYHGEGNGHGWGSDNRVSWYGPPQQPPVSGFTNPQQEFSEQRDREGEWTTARKTSSPARGTKHTATTVGAVEQQQNRYAALTDEKEDEVREEGTKDESSGGGTATIGGQKEEGDQQKKEVEGNNNNGSKQKKNGKKRANKKKKKDGKHGAGSTSNRPDQASVPVSGRKGTKGDDNAQPKPTTIQGVDHNKEAIYEATFFTIGKELMTDGEVESDFISSAPRRQQAVLLTNLATVASLARLGTSVVDGTDIKQDVFNYFRQAKSTKSLYELINDHEGATTDQLHQNIEQFQKTGMAGLQTELFSQEDLDNLLLNEKISGSKLYEILQRWVTRHFAASGGSSLKKKFDTISWTKEGVDKLMALDGSFLDSVQLSTSLMMK